MLTVCADNVSWAWLSGTRQLLKNGGACFDLVVEIEHPLEVDPRIDKAYHALVSNHDLIPPKHVAYTIFPYSCYLRVGRSPEKLFDRYNRAGGIFDRLRSMKHSGWGTYFRRMTHYVDVDRDGERSSVNQLAEIRRMLRQRRNAYKTAYTVNIRRPSQDLKRTLGSPCLMALAVRLDQGRLSLLAVYRRQDLVERAYGNYQGLGHLMEFLADDSKYSVGALTCLASYASLEPTQGRASWPRRRELCQLVDELGEAPS